ncbi:MAG: PstS family phosphate ABC transporter substrate-binding protein [Bacteroidales bacterium]|nr:PstS family phosphate ABC transporter substrate-binding protein [Bacteroidales bacterium]
MRKRFIFTLAIITYAFLFGITGCKNPQESKSQGIKGNISISGAFAIYPITVRWAEEFQKIYPEVKIDISAGGAGKGMADALSQMVDLGMFSREVTKEEKDKGAWWIALTKDAVLPTVNANNPFINELKKTGVSRDNFIKIYITGEITSWEKLINTNKTAKINIFTRSDACGAAAMWAQYLGKNQEDLLGLGVFGDPGVSDAVKNDIYGLGFNNVIYVYDINTRTKYDKLEVIPIDLNENGSIDKEENFYDSLDLVMKAIKDDIYPSPPARDLYYVSKGKPERVVVIKFIEWILTEGQQYVKEAGYVQLSDEKIKAELKKLKE